MAGRRAAVHASRAMNGSNGNSHVDAATLAQAAAAERFARAAIAAFGSCEAVGAPLSDVQKIALLESMLREFDGFSARLDSLSTIAGLLRDLGHD
jgi:hypothetical protein